MITLIYGVIFLQFLCRIIMGTIIKSISGVSFVYMINAINRSRLEIFIFNIPQLSRIEFI